MDQCATHAPAAGDSPTRGAPEDAYVAEMSEQETIVINSRSAASKYAAVTAG
jgi:hypothetical protein